MDGTVCYATYAVLSCLVPRLWLRLCLRLRLWLCECGCRCECAGYLILDKDDPTKILQRESRMLWPKYNWERANQTDPATDWEYYKNCSEYYVTWRIQI